MSSKHHSRITVYRSLFTCKLISLGLLWPWVRGCCFAFAEQVHVFPVARLALVMYGLSLSKIPYADFPDTFIYVHSLIENLIFKVIILIDVCHFDQAVAHRCFVRTILQVSLSSCLSLLTFSMADSKKTQWRLRGDFWQASQIQIPCVFTTKNNSSSSDLF